MKKLIINNGNTVVFLVLIALSCNSVSENEKSKKINSDFQWVKIPAGEYILGDSGSLYNPIHQIKSKEFFRSILLAFQTLPLWFCSSPVSV